MARKKKQKTNTQTNSLVYSGNVTVQVLHGNKVVSTKKIHNSGRIPLFKFIAYCLGNNYYDNMAPRFLRTFNVGVENFDNLTVLMDDNNEKSDIVAFSSITYEDGVDASTQKEFAKVRFTFLLPGSQIVNSGELEIDTLCLYSLDTFSRESRSNPLAYVNLKDSQGSRDPIEFTSGVNLVIIWELSIGNNA